MRISTNLQTHQAVGSLRHNADIRTLNICTVSELFRIFGLPTVDSSPVNRLLFRFRRFNAKERVHRAMDDFENLYLLLEGVLKTSVLSTDGNAHVSNFPMVGDIVGIDGMHLGKYNSETIALTSCLTLVLPFQKVVAIGREHMTFRNAILNKISCELARTETTIQVLGSGYFSCDARVAHFLTIMSERLALESRQATTFILPLSRKEIAEYLNIAVESISRTLSKFHALGLIKVASKKVTLLNPIGLRELQFGKMEGR